MDQLTDAMNSILLSLQGLVLNTVLITGILFLITLARIIYKKRNNKPIGLSKFAFYIFGIYTFGSGLWIVISKLDIGYFGLVIVLCSLYALAKAPRKENCWQDRLDKWLSTPSYEN